MNCPSRTDELPRSDGLNQSPNALSNDLTSNEELNGRANARRLRRSRSPSIQSAGEIGASLDKSSVSAVDPDAARVGTVAGGEETVVATVDSKQPETLDAESAPSPPAAAEAGAPPSLPSSRYRGNSGRTLVCRVFALGKTFLQFVGPGFVVSVSYIDPGNYATDIAAGASYRFSLLFVVLLSNIFAIFLQSLAIKLGTVSGLNLAQACRAYLPRWLNITLYVLAELAIVATDIAEVIGTAIALNLLQPRIPLVAGCAISIVDVLVVLVFCRPDTGAATGTGTRRSFRLFEFIVIPLVLGVVICFCLQLTMISGTSSARVGDVFRGYLPSSALVEAHGLYQACGILGATVMPHSLYLGSGIVQARLREFDAKHEAASLATTPATDTVLAALRTSHNDDSVSNGDEDRRAAVLGRLGLRGRFLDDDNKLESAPYVPSLAAVRHALKYSIAELALTLFTFALFVNSAILIVAGAALYGNAELANGGGDIFAIHRLLATTLSPAAGTIFALALLLSGLSAGVVCTVAGQMLSEGALCWTVLTAPWQRRLLTRSISILPSIVVAGAVGRRGLDTALTATQVVLSVVLPFVTAPLLWFTSLDKYMTVGVGEHARVTRITEGAATLSDPEAPPEEAPADVKMGNAWQTVVVGVLIWLIITAMDVANLVLLGIGSSK